MAKVAGAELATQEFSSSSSNEKVKVKWEVTSANKEKSMFILIMSEQSTTPHRPSFLKGQMEENNISGSFAFLYANNFSNLLFTSIV